MPIIIELNSKQHKFLIKRDLFKKWLKIKIFLENNLGHPSLNWEKIVIKHNTLYSFRLDRKYRGICYLKNDDKIEIIAFTNHYQ